MAISFEWDRRKAGINVSKHGVNFYEAATVFGDPLARIFDDPGHSISERREIIVGRSKQAVLLLVSFIEVESGRVRIISARTATRQERHDYEEAAES